MAAGNLGDDLSERYHEFKISNIMQEKIEIQLNIILNVNEQVAFMKRLREHNVSNLNEYVKNFLISKTRNLDQSKSKSIPDDKTLDFKDGRCI